MSKRPFCGVTPLFAVTEPIPSIIVFALPLLLTPKLLLLAGKIVLSALPLIGLLLLPIDIGLATLSTINCGLLMPSLDGSMVLELLLIVLVGDGD